MHPRLEGPLGYRESRTKLLLGDAVLFVEPLERDHQAVLSSSLFQVTGSTHRRGHFQEGLQSRFTGGAGWDERDAALGA